MKSKTKALKNHQYDLFESKDVFINKSFCKYDLVHNRSSLTKWRDKIYAHQNNICKVSNDIFIQKSLILSQDENEFYRNINPFLLTSFSINFWRSNKSIHKGPAMYFVIDSIKNSQIILYIGETNSADKRWKGDHDCKNYISNYKETMSNNNLESNLDIRFYLDVPKEVKLRRKLEKQLIYLWLPPFNKETRNRWTTTFTNN